MDEHIDLTPLDPEGDPTWRQRLVSSVMTHVAVLAPPAGSLTLNEVEGPGATTSPRHAQRGHGTVSELIVIGRPALLAASLVATVALVMGRRDERPAPGSERVAMAEALGLSGPLARWVAHQEMPSTADVVAALQGYGETR